MSESCKFVKEKCNDSAGIITYISGNFLIKMSKFGGFALFKLLKRKS